jgi:hypothetical protein
MQVRCEVILNDYNKRIRQDKVKVALVLLTEHHAMNAYWESEGIASLIL